MEACGGAHYWARELMKLGHEVRPIAPQFVKPYVKSSKNDANDAEAICEAASRPTMRFVEIKMAEQQAGQALHRVHSRQVGRIPPWSMNCEGCWRSWHHQPHPRCQCRRRLVAEALEDGDNGLPGAFRALLAQLSEELKQLDAHVATLDQQIRQRCAADERIQRLMAIEGVDPISARLKNKGQPRSGETGMFFMPPRRARAGRLAGGWRDNAVRRQTARPPESPSSHLRAS